MLLLYLRNVKLLRDLEWSKKSLFIIIVSFIFLMCNLAYLWNLLLRGWMLCAIWKAHSLQDFTLNAEKSQLKITDCFLNRGLGFYIQSLSKQNIWSSLLAKKLDMIIKVLGCFRELQSLFNNFSLFFLENQFLLHSIFIKNTKLIFDTQNKKISLDELGKNVHTYSEYSGIFCIVLLLFCLFPAPAEIISCSLGFQHSLLTFKPFLYAVSKDVVWHLVICSSQMCCKMSFV